MGRSLYRHAAFRKSIKSLKSKRPLWLLAPLIGFVVAFGIFAFSDRRRQTSLVNLSETVIRPIEAVAALGQLSPLGEVRRLAAPISGFGGTPRVAALLINEGDFVRQGQTLAVFDNRPQILADLLGVRARINTLEIKIRIQTKQLSRYKQAAIEGAASLITLEDKQDQLVKLKGLKNEAYAELKGLQADFENSELKTPIDGVILRIRAQVGERPGEEGVLEVGANQSMEALIEVYESDINRVKVDQSVSLTSENGGFKGTLYGKVKTISPQVRQRRVLSTDPTGDADAKIVEVRIILEPDSAAQVNRLTGMKVIAKFESK